MRLYGSTSPFFGAEVAVLAPSTWFVLLNDTTTGRLDLAVARGEHSVPYLPLRAGAALEGWGRPSRIGRWPDFLPARDAIVADGEVVYPAAHGAGLPFVQRYICRDASSASSAAADLRGL